MPEIFTGCPFPGPIWLSVGRAVGNEVTVSVGGEEGWRQEWELEGQPREDRPVCFCVGMVGVHVGSPQLSAACPLLTSPDRPQARSQGLLPRCVLLSDMDRERNQRGAGTEEEGQRVVRAAWPLSGYLAQGLRALLPTLQRGWHL